RAGQIDDPALVGRALPEPTRDDRHLFKLPALDGLQLVSLVIRRDELPQLARGLLTLQAPRHREPPRQHDVRRAIFRVAGHYDEVVFRDDLAQASRAMR